MMTELEKLTAAREYIGMLARGRDPITGADVSRDSVLNNIHISRCLLYVEDVLARLAAGTGPAAKSGPAATSEPAAPTTGGAYRKKPRRAPFSITREQLDRYEFPPEPLPVSKIAQRISDLVPSDGSMKKLCYRDITAFLLDAGALRTLRDSDGKEIKRPTSFGESLGISVEQREGASGPYSVVLYDRDAQQFILDNMESILAERE